MKRDPLMTSSVILFILLMLQSCASKNNGPAAGEYPDKKYLTAALVWPAYHQEPLMKEFYRGDIGEWERIRNATPKFDGHIQPRYPLWGYVMEDDPEVMEMKIETAAKYGLDIFIYDWYWYNEGPYLEEALNEGYLKAKNNDKVKFYIMWANHDAMTTWDIERSHERKVVWPGTVDRKNFDLVVQRIITRYFSHPSYLKIDGKPVFNIYDLANLMKGLGGIGETEDALAYFREEVKKAGFPGLHMQVMLRNSMVQDQAEVGGAGPSAEVVEKMGFNSSTHYQWVHVSGTGRDYVDWGMEAMEQWPECGKSLGIPYWPHVSIGWDNNPRFSGEMDIIYNTTPQAFKSFMIKAREYLDEHPDQPQIITINSWNEWVEGSYLEPDIRNGYAYLEALQSAMTGEH